LIAAAAVADLAAAATDSVVAVGLAAGALGALVGSAAAAAGSEGVDEDHAWNFPIFFLEKLKPQTNH
jgi:hypothetical protein